MNLCLVWSTFLLSFAHFSTIPAHALALFQSPHSGVVVSAIGNVILLFYIISCFFSKLAGSGYWLIYPSANDTFCLLSGFSDTMAYAVLSLLNATVMSDESGQMICFGT